MVENANLDDPTMEAITFLYTLANGMCDKSYGFYTAKMAGLNTEVNRIENLQIVQRKQL